MIAAGYSCKLKLCLASLASPPQAQQESHLEIETEYLGHHLERTVRVFDGHHHQFVPVKKKIKVVQHNDFTKGFHRRAKLCH